MVGFFEIDRAKKTVWSRKEFRIGELVALGGVIIIIISFFVEMPYVLLKIIALFIAIGILLMYFAWRKYYV